MKMSKFQRWNYSCFNKMIYFFILFEKHKYGEREMTRDRKRERESFIHWFTLKIATRAGAGQNWSQEPRDFSGSPKWVQGPKDLGSFPLPSQVIIQEAGWEMELLGLNPLPTWDAGITGRGLACFTMLPGPMKLLLMQL